MARTSTTTTKPKATPAAKKAAKPAAQRKPEPAKASDQAGLTSSAAQPLAGVIVQVVKDEATRTVFGEALKRPDGAVAGEQIEVVFVKSVPTTLRRCGFRFTQEGMGIALSCLTHEQLEILESDPDLVVQRGSVDAIGDEA
ncbi:HI1506-related protein [Achromobacter insolitus]|uniref:HI1506-related protein n=1 Tax=Achromobacter insolitus TaxID=217204 RepID=UPI001EED0394|nr:HI1506-related protein [Achromobacter insolitus]